MNSKARCTASILQSLAQETVTIRHGINDTAVPYRQMGSFKPGTGVGGAGSHWSGCHFRALPEDFKLCAATSSSVTADVHPAGHDDPGFPGQLSKSWNRTSITSNTSAALPARPA